MTATLEAPREEALLTRSMPQRALGSLGWNASALTLGGVRWDTLLSDTEAVNLVHRAIELGVNTFDTAHVYGNGESERKLGLALEGIRSRYWLNTKVIDRTYDGAKRMMETSLQRLRTDYVDLMFVHSVDSEEQRQQIIGPNSVLKAVEEFRAAGHLRYIGVSGHWVRDVMARLLDEFPFDAVLFPAGIFNIAYQYPFVDTVLPKARAKKMAVLGMKIFGAGRVKDAPSITPYLRYALHQDIDTAVIGVDNIPQLEEIVQVIKERPAPLTSGEFQTLLPEIQTITQRWEEGEFNFLEWYTQHRDEETASS